MKSLFSSKTFWLASLQGLIAIVVIFQGAYPAMGALMILKSVLDISLRIATTQPVTV